MDDKGFALAREKERDYVQAMDNDSIEQFREKPKIAALYNALARQLQDARTFLSELMDDRFVSTAIGKQLDGVGDIAVLTRMEAGLLSGNPIPCDVMDDETYRKYLVFKILKNNCDCTYPDIVRALRMFWDKPLYYREEIDEPATMIFDTGIMVGDVDTSPLFATPLLRAAGVTLKIYARTQKDIPSKRLEIASGLGFAETTTYLPGLEPDYHIWSHLSIAGGFHTFSQNPVVQNYEPDYNFLSRLGFASDYGSVTREHVPRCEPPFIYRERVRIGASFHTESKDALPRAEPEMNFRFRFKLAGDFRSVAHEELPRIEREYNFDHAPGPAEKKVDVSDEQKICSRVGIASGFQSTSEDVLPKLEATHEFASRLGITSGLQISSDSEMPHLEPEQKFKGKATLVSDARSITDTQV